MDSATGNTLSNRNDNFLHKSRLLCIEVLLLFLVQLFSILVQIYFTELFECRSFTCNGEFLHFWVLLLPQTVTFFIIFCFPSCALCACPSPQSLIDILFRFTPRTSCEVRDVVVQYQYQALRSPLTKLWIGPWWVCYLAPGAVCHYTPAKQM